MQYNELGQEIERILPGEVLSQWQYDSTDRPTNHRVTSQQRFTRRRAYQSGANHRLKGIVNKNKYTGEWRAYEIKTTATNRNPRLSRDQRGLGANLYTLDRLQRAATGKGHYQSLTIQQRAHAKRILGEVVEQGGIKSATQINVFVDSTHKITKVRGKKWCP